MLHSNPYGNLGELKTFKNDEVVYTQNSQGNSLYIVTKGVFGVYIKSTDDSPLRVTEIKEGGIFGEMSAIDAWKRSSTVVCEGKGAAVLIDSEALPALLEKHPDISGKILHMLYERAESIAKIAVEKGKSISDLPENLVNLAPKNHKLDLENMRSLAQRIKELNDVLSEYKTNLVPKIKHTEEDSASNDTKLFPPRHGSYSHELSNEARMISIIKTDCPICKSNFESHFVLLSMLRRDRTDPDMRVRYMGIEPLHYSIVTCPKCLFSAESGEFSKVSDKHAGEVFEKLKQYKDEVTIKTGKERDISTVFTGYYLALLCVPFISETPEMTTASLWLKISRLYEDCNAKEMFIYAVEKALTAYNTVYTKTRIDDTVSRQVAFILGELNFKLENYEESRRMFFIIKEESKTNFNIPQSLLIAVENRLEVLRELVSNVKT
jgi:hypothetical protein